MTAAAPLPDDADVKSLIRAVNSCRADINTIMLAQQRDSTATQTALAGVTSSVENLTKALGFEDTDKYGKPIGEGLRGRVMRVERRQDAHDGWMAKAKWIGSGLVALGGAVGLALRPLVDFLAGGLAK